MRDPSPPSSSPPSNTPPTDPDAPRTAAPGRRARTVAIGVIAAVLVLVAGVLVQRDQAERSRAATSALAAGHRRPGRTAVTAAGPAATTTETTTEPLPTTTSEPAGPTMTEPSLPVPEPLPLDPYADTPEVVVARIVIPAIGLDEDVHQGMTLTAINRGPSHWPGTALPGQLGNVVIAGHRTTYGKPFRDLDQLQPGDQVIYRTGSGTFTYVATHTEIVTPDEVHIADQTAAYTSTLFACHPPGSAAYRIVVRLELQGEPAAKPPGGQIGSDSDGQVSVASDGQVGTGPNGSAGTAAVTVPDA